FFQAEDGIRDLIVTGVQTCALPILQKIRPLHGGDEYSDHFLLGSDRNIRPHRAEAEFFVLPLGNAVDKGAVDPPPLKERVAFGRSEERRVGKEWRCGWGCRS